MNIKNYLPDFIIEKAYNLSAEDLKKIILNWYL